MVENAGSFQKLAPKVVWSEGMYIGPHHFQLQSRYFEDVIRFAASCHWFEPYGFTGLELDPEALRNGAAVLLHAQGIFPDGLPFHMPETDALPAPHSITDLFPPTLNAATLLLGVPLHKGRGLNCTFGEPSLGERAETRYVAETRVIPDENTGGDERPVQIARKSLCLLLETEPTIGLATLPLARIVRDGAGRFAYDPEFVPPTLQIQASRRLMLLVRRLIEILDEKSAAIGFRRSIGSELSAGEIAKFWLLHTVNSAGASLRHLLTVKRGHPEDLFVELSRLAGALCTFKLGSHPRQLPLYNHRSPSACFEALDRHIREHLEITVPTNCLTIPLKSTDGCFYDGQISDQRCLGRSQWLLAVRSPVAEAELMMRAPLLVKICSSRFVRELVKRSLPGLGLMHLAVPPAAVSPGVEKQYFTISRTGPSWDHIVQTRSVGVYIPADIPTPEVEVLVVLENS